MFIQGLGILLPTNLRIYFEMRKNKPDISRIQRLMRMYVKVVAIQGSNAICNHLYNGRVCYRIFSEVVANLSRKIG